MSNVSIFEKKWIDLVFEGKNKEYGAYQLRQENPKTTIKALFAAVLFIGSLSGLGMLLSSFGNHPPMDPPIVINDTTVIIPVDLSERPKLPNHPPAAPKTPAAPAMPTYIPVETPLVPPDVETPPTTPVNPTNGPSGENPGTGPSTGDPRPGGGGTGPVTTPTPNNPTPTVMLDEQPEFPGGIKKFYEYVGRNFEKPSIDDEETVSVLVSFVIEKDGSMTDIKVLRNPGYGLDKEAVRVLKSLRTKWKPGVKDNQYVRTQYTLPIKIQMN